MTLKPGFSFSIGSILPLSVWVSQTVNGSTQTMMETTSESTFAGGADDDHVSKHAMSYVRMDRPRRTVTGRVQQQKQATSLSQEFTI